MHSIFGNLGISLMLLFCQKADCEISRQEVKHITYDTMIKITTYMDDTWKYSALSFSSVGLSFLQSRPPWHKRGVSYVEDRTQRLLQHQN